MSRIWAVARHMIAESIRTRVAVLFVAAIVLILAITPFVVAGDGVTLKSKVQNSLAYSLGLVGVLLSFLTVFLACGTLASEIQQRQIFMVVSKPIARWQFFVGKWLGIVLLDGCLLLVTFLSVLGSTWYLKRQPPSSPEDAKALQEEVFTVRHNYRLDQLDWPRLAKERIRALREEGRIGPPGTVDESALASQIIPELKIGHRTLPPRTGRQYAFRGMMAVDRQKGFLLLHFKPVHSGGTEDLLFDAVIQSGDPNEPETLTQEVNARFIVGRFHTVPIPAYAVNSQNTLYVRILNLDAKDAFVFEGENGIELLYPFGTFHWNLARALSIIWFRLAFLAVLGLVGSSFVSFPVACMGAFLVLGVASAAGYLGEAMEWTVAGPANRPDTFWIFTPVMRLLGQGFVWLVPDFSKFDAVGNVVGGLYVPTQWVVMSFAVLVLMQGLVLGLIGCVVLTRRELAQVVV